MVNNGWLMLHTFWSICTEIGSSVAVSTSQVALKALLKRSSLQHDRQSVGLVWAVQAR